MDVEPVRYATTMGQEGGSADFFSPTKAVKPRETWSEGEYRFAVLHTTSHPPSFPLPPAGVLSPVLDLPIFRLGLELVPMDANRIRSTHGSGHSLWIWEHYCSLAGLWYFNYPTTRGPQCGPAGDKWGVGVKLPSLHGNNP